MSGAAGRRLNKLASSVAKLTKPLPDAYKPWGYTLAFDSMVSASLESESVCVIAEKNSAPVPKRRGGCCKVPRPTRGLQGRRNEQSAVWVF